MPEVKDDPKVQFSVTVRQSVRDALDALARDRDCQRADVVRDALLSFLRQQSQRRAS